MTEYEDEEFEVLDDELPWDDLTRNILADFVEVKRRARDDYYDSWSDYYDS